MLDFRQVGQNLEAYQTALLRRGVSPELLGRVQAGFQKRQDVIKRAQAAQERRNKLSAEMKDVMKSGTDEAKAKARDEGRQVSDEVKALEAENTKVDADLEALMLEIPNRPHDSVPDGLDEAHNQEVRRGGLPPSFAFEPKDHVAIGADILGVLDFQRATKIAGSRFVVEYGDAARLERALAAFMIDVHTREHDYTEVAVPLLLNRNALYGTGQLPKFEGDLFKVPVTEDTTYYLVPTAEVPITNLFNDEIIDGEEMPLPLAFCGFTPCFRSEAGAAGKDTRGMIRQHQFGKVEMVRFSAPETSYVEHEKMVSHAEAILKKLGLHYRVMALCAGDMGAAAAKCYDVEVWLPGQKRFREISSCSNCEDYQARRAKIRFKKDKKDKARLVHTLNGSGLPTGRTLIALFENFQDKDGVVHLPEVLWPYMGGVKKIEPQRVVKKSG